MIKYVNIQISAYSIALVAKAKVNVVLFDLHKIIKIKRNTQTIKTLVVLVAAD